MYNQKKQTRWMIAYCAIMIFTVITAVAFSTAFTWWDSPTYADYDSDDHVNVTVVWDSEVTPAPVPSPLPPNWAPPPEPSPDDHIWDVINNPECTPDNSMAAPPLEQEQEPIATPSPTPTYVQPTETPSTPDVTIVYPEPASSEEMIPGHFEQEVPPEPTSVESNGWTKMMTAAHERANTLRAFGASDDSPAIQECKDIWWAEKDAMDILARTMYMEARDCPWRHVLSVGAVVLNRVRSDLFPNTVKEVIEQPYQYSVTYAYAFMFDKTPARYYAAARILLDGEYNLPGDVLYQAQFPQGSGIYWESHVHTQWWDSTTYFCYV